MLLSSDRHHSLRGELGEWLRFLRSESHVLRSDPALLFQQAFNQPAGKAPARAFANRPGAAGTSRPWLRWTNKPENWTPCVLAIAAHDDEISRCRFSSDGSRILSCSIDGTARLWDAATGLEVRRFDHGRADLTCVAALSADGRQLAASFEYSPLRFWDVGSGTVTGEIDFGGVRDLHYLPDGERLVAITADRVAVWRVRTATPLWAAEFEGVTDDDLLTCCAVSGDGRRLMTGSVSGRLVVRDVDSGREIRRREGNLEIHNLNHFEVIAKACTFLGASSLVCVCGYESKVWDTERDLVVHEFGGDEEACAASPDGALVAYTSRRALFILDVGTGAITAPYVGHDDMLTDCAFSPDGRHVVTASRDGTLRVWDVTGAPLAIQHRGRIVKCVFAAGDRQLLTASRDASLKVWNAESGAEIGTVENTADFVDLAARGGGREGVTVDFNDALRFWEIATGVERCEPDRSSKWNCCDVSASGRIAAGSTNGFVKVWNDCGESDTEIEAHQDAVVCCRFSPDQTALLTISDDRTARLWDLDDRSLIYTIPAGPEGRPVTTGLGTRTWFRASRSCCSFSRDGARLCIVERTVWIWDARTGGRIGEAAVRDRIVACAYSPDPLMFATASASGDVVVWEGNASPQPIAHFPSSTELTALAWSSDGRCVAAGSDDGRLFLLELRH